MEFSPSRYDGSHRTGQIEAYDEWVKLGCVRSSTDGRIVMLEKRINQHV